MLEFDSANTHHRPASPRLSLTFIASLDQALKVVGEVGATLGRLNSQALPKALRDLKTTSDNLSKLSAQIDIVGSVGLVLLIAALLLAIWCFIHSLGALMLAKSRVFDVGKRRTYLS